MSSNAEPLAPRRRAFLLAGDAARYFSGGPYLLVSTDIFPEGAASRAFGLDTIFVSIGSDAIHFFRDPEIGLADEFVETAELPSDLLAIVAKAGDAAILGALWTDRGLESPPVIAVTNPVEAMGPILARAKAELADASVRNAELQRALVATRAEFEETRSAMQGVMRTLSHRYATKMNLTAAAAPSADRTVTLDPSGALKRTYPAGTEGVTCFALHIADLRKDANAVLRVSFLGLESGRLLGEWRRPMEALFKGWNVFDFPSPVMGVRETVAIEVALDGAGAAALDFSLSGDAAEGTDEGAPFAIRIWTADAGGRFPYAAHWMWNAQGSFRPADGTVALAGDDVLARIVARGKIETMPKPDGGVAGYLLRGGSSLLHLADISVQGAEGISLDLKHGFGDVRGTRFELVVQSSQHGFTSGLQSFGAGDSVLKLGVSLPAALPECVDLILLIEDVKRADQLLASIALQRVQIIAGPRSSLVVGARPERIQTEAWPLSGDGTDTPHFVSLKAANYSENDKYALFEVTISEFTFGRRAEREVKFKISKANERLSLEFRQGPNWPKVFRDWPGREQDRFGDVFRIAQAGEDIAIAGKLAPGPDRDVVAALCKLMPTIVAAGVQSFPSAAARIPEWLDAARSLAAAAKRAFETPGA